MLLSFVIDFITLSSSPCYWLFAYKLILPLDAKVHPIFHVFKLKPFHGMPPQSPPLLDASIIATLVELQPAQVLGSRNIHNSHSLIQQCLIQWEGLPTMEATWEGKELLLKNYPNFNLENKVVFDGGSNVTGLSGAKELNTTHGPITTKEPNDAKPRRVKK